MNARGRVWDAEMGREGVGEGEQGRLLLDQSRWLSRIALDRESKSMDDLLCVCVCVCVRVCVD